MLQKYISLKQKTKKTMSGFIEKIFIGLLTSLVNGFNPTKCISLSNQKCITQPTFIILQPN